jgi:hypothetical protein
VDKSKNFTSAKTQALKLEEYQDSIVAHVSITEQHFHSHLTSRHSEICLTNAFASEVDSILRWTQTFCCASGSMKRVWIPIPKMHVIVVGIVEKDKQACSQFQMTAGEHYHTSSTYEK